MSKQKTIKVLDEYQAVELGLPVLIKGAPVINIDGEEVIDIDFDAVSEALFAALILKPITLTGAEVRFMRLFVELTLEELAKRLHVTHASVINWEKTGDTPTRMSDSTEAILRLFAAKHGARDHELIEVILNQFFTQSNSKDETLQPSTRIVELNTQQPSEPPRVRFTGAEEDLAISEA